MKKIILFFLVFVSALRLSAQNDTLSIGLCQGRLADTGTSTEKGNTWVSCGTRLTTTLLKPYAGNKIVQIKVGLSSRINIDTLRVWVKNSLTGQPLGEGIITSRGSQKIKKGWNVVTLDTPVDITSTSRFFIGYDLKQRGSTPAISLVKPGQIGSYYYKANSSAKAYRDLHTQGCLSIEANITGDNLPMYDLVLNSAVGNFDGESGDLDMTAEVYNKATRTVDGFTITTTVKGTEETYNTQINEPIEPGQTSTFKFTLHPDDGSIDGDTRLTVDISALKDQEDIDKTNNTVEISPGFRRNVLIEEFTTEQCPNCPRVAGYLHTALEDPSIQGRVFAVAHHAMYYTDWLTLQQSVVDGYTVSTDVHNYYPLYNNTRGTYAPAVMYDRQAEFESETGGATPVMIPGSSNEIVNIAKVLMDEPAAVTITNLSAHYANDSTIVVEVEGMKNANAGANPRVTVMLTEDNINAHSQSGANGSFIHQHVSRAINNIWGDPVTWDGNNFSYEVSLGLNTVYNTKIDAGTFQEEWRQWNHDNMNIVAFVNYYTQNASGCKIENVASIKLPKATAINGISSVGKDIVSTEVYTIDGKRVAPEAAAHGLFIVRTKTADGNVTTKKVVLK